MAVSKFWKNNPTDAQILEDMLLPDAPGMRHHSFIELSSGMRTCHTVLVTKGLTGHVFTISFAVHKPSVLLFLTVNPESHREKEAHHTEPLSLQSSAFHPQERGSSAEWWASSIWWSQQDHMYISENTSPELYHSKNLPQWECEWLDMIRALPQDYPNYTLMKLFKFTTFEIVTLWHTTNQSHWHIGFVEYYSLSPSFPIFPCLLCHQCLKCEALERKSSF